MLRRRDRKFLGCPEDYLFRSDGSGRADLIDPRTNKPRCDGVIWGQVWTYYAYNLPDFPTVVLLQPDYGDNLAQYVPTCRRRRATETLLSHRISSR